MFDGMSQSAYTFQREAFADVIGEGRPVLARQWIESGEQGVGELRLDDDRYLTMDRAGLHRLFSVRHRGEFIGYASMFVFVGMHAAAKAAVADALYLVPEHRRPGLSMRLVAHVERALIAEGVTVIHWEVNARFPGFGRILERLGYKPISTTHAKVMPHAS